MRLETWITTENQQLIALGSLENSNRLMVRGMNRIQVLAIVKAAQSASRSERERVIAKPKREKTHLRKGNKTEERER